MADCSAQLQLISLVSLMMTHVHIERVRKTVARKQIKMISIGMLGKRKSVVISFPHTDTRDRRHETSQKLL